MNVQNMQFSEYWIYQFVPQGGDPGAGLGKWECVAEVNGDKITPFISPELSPSVHIMKNEIFTEIKQHQGTQIESDYSIVSKICGQNDDQMEFLFLGTMRYRQCTVYLVLQFSHKTTETRVVAYGTDQIIHEGESFGTNLQEVKDFTLINEIHERIRKRLNPCDMGINFTALKRLQEGEYTLFV